jgi:hypothetical protein
MSAGGLERMTVKELDEIEAQLDSNAPYYLPRLLVFAREQLKDNQRLRAAMMQARRIAEGSRVAHNGPVRRTIDTLNKALELWR